ncbi:MAG TPA: hypothetical protein VLM11_18130 [Streptosporangiaceae bacterium]|nr:hypothetical protein [Streptosporangiaceae bacterium]
MAQQSVQVLDTQPGRTRTSPAGWLVLGLVLLAAAVVAAGTVAITRPSPSAASVSVRAREPQAPTSVLGGSPAIASASAARTLLATAPAAVVASTANRADLAAAATIARSAHAPMLLIPPSATAGQVAALRSTIRALTPAAVLGIGITRRALAADLPGVHLVSSAGALPVTAAAAPMRNVVVIVHTGTSAAARALAIAATATAGAAGARVIDLPGYDPRADATAIRALAAARPQRIVAVGAGFGSASLVSGRAAVAETGVQLPGGGQVLFPGRRIIALYGTPGTPALGVLGHQGLTASIARAKATAAQYARLVKVPVIPSFEIIATVAQASAGRLGIYSFESTVKSLRPWVTAASKAGLYVTLDLQPGRGSLLAQAKRYQSLLRLPNVGLALDPEWKLKSRQLPLHQIGSVKITEVNSVVSWLAALTARYHLPQKLLELHEFRLTMIRDIAGLDTHHDDLAIVINMDGQGAPGTKLQTWQVVVANAPKGVYFGWKDFYTKDTPMLGPARTIRHRPTPMLISYQ